MKYEIKVTFESPKIMSNKEFQELLDLTALQVEEYGKRLLSTYDISYVSNSGCIFFS